MVQLGVPPMAVKLKMQSEGIDPDILDQPDLPCVHDAEQDDE